MRFKCTHKISGSEFSFIVILIVILIRLLGEQREAIVAKLDQ